MDRFVQAFPPLPDVYADDRMVQAVLDRRLGEVGHKRAAPLLEALAADVRDELRAAHVQAEAHPPMLTRYDGWGRRIDRVETPTGWETQRRAAARHGLVALPYEAAAREEFGAGARIVQHALLHLYGPESATFSCPVAMSDGAARLLSAPDLDPALAARWLPRLLSRDPDRAVTAGQWMTETTGGSDVSGAATTARRVPDGSWRLTGEKWFCSAVDGAVAIVLARPDGASAGVQGLCCFVLPRYAADVPGAPADPGAAAPGLHIHRLKDKLGTRALPTAEVGLVDAYAWPVGDPSRPGLGRMMQLAQVTRLHNAAAAAAGMRRGMQLARNHAAARNVFGERLDRQPLHRETLAWLAADADAAYALTALCFGLLGAVENPADAAAADRGTAGDAAALLRLAASLAKAYTGKLAVGSASEYVECFGGNGYIEDTGVPRLLRDAQVLPIWEGTTNVLALDVVRTLGRGDALPAYLHRVDAALAASAAVPLLSPLLPALRAVRDAVAADAAAPEPAAARTLALRMAALLAAAELADQAVFDTARGDERSAVVAQLWIRRRVIGESTTGEGHRYFGTVVDGQ